VFPKGLRSAGLWLLLLPAAAWAQTAPADPLYYLNTRQRFDSYIFRTYTDPQRLSWILVDSATATWWKDPHQWDRNAEGYSYRVASAFGRRIVHNTYQLGFETLLHEDSRYRPSGAQGLPKRVLYAVRHSMIAYRPDGSTGPAYGRIAAGVVTEATSSTWHPRSIGAGALLGSIGQSALDRATGNLFTEFEPDLKTFGRKEWNRLRRK
jgi:hypothetical protein